MSIIVLKYDTRRRCEHLINLTSWQKFVLFLVKLDIFPTIPLLYYLLAFTSSFDTIPVSSRKNAYVDVLNKIDIENEFSTSQFL